MHTCCLVCRKLPFEEHKIWKLFQINMHTVGSFLQYKLNIPNLLAPNITQAGLVLHCSYVAEKHAN